MIHASSLALQASFAEGQSLSGLIFFGLGNLFIAFASLRKSLLGRNVGLSIVR